MAEPTVTLKLTVDQAEAMLAALDMYSRLGMGQVMALDMLVRTGEIPAHRHSLTGEQLEMITQQLAGFQGLLGYSSGQSLGIAHERATLYAKRAWEIMKVASRVLAIHKNPSPTHNRGVAYDGLTLRYTKDRLPEVSIG